MHFISDNVLRLSAAWPTPSPKTCHKTKTYRALHLGKLSVQALNKEIYLTWSLLASIYKINLSQQLIPEVLIFAREWSLRFYKYFRVNCSRQPSADFSSRPLLLMLLKDSLNGLKKKARIAFPCLKEFSFASKGSQCLDGHF